MQFFEDPLKWKNKEIRHVDPMTLPPLGSEEEAVLREISLKSSDSRIPWVIPTGNNPPWLRAAPPPLLTYPPFPKLSQDMLKLFLGLMGLLLVLIIAVPDLVGCFCFSILFFLAGAYYHHELNMPQFRSDWKRVHHHNSQHFKRWQIQRCQFTRKWLADMAARRDVWKELQVQDSDNHFARGDEIVRNLSAGFTPESRVVKTMESARKKYLQSLALKAEDVKDYTRAARYYEKLGDRNRARSLNEKTHGGNQYIKVGSLDQSVTIQDSVVLRSSIGGGGSRDIQDSIVQRSGIAGKDYRLRDEAVSGLKMESDHGPVNPEQDPSVVALKLGQLSALRVQGQISEAEFQRRKTELLRK